MAHERPTEPRAAMEGLLAKPRSFANLPDFLDLKVINVGFNSKSNIKLKSTLKFDDFNVFLKL